MTCAKIQVFCTIIDTKGKKFHGENYCFNPQEVCPRDPGEGYEKCHTICNQAGHAEPVTIIRAQGAGAKLKGAKAVISGHYRICDNCVTTLNSVGIEDIELIEDRDEAKQYIKEL